MDKNKLVYSTNPNAISKDENFDEDLNLDLSSQKLRVRLETKQRGGKKVSVVGGFEGSIAELEKLSKTLKTKLGIGGAVKDGEILLQGDYVVKLKELLIQLGYKNTK